MWVQPKEYQRVGRVLIQARRDAGFTQAELAKKLRKPQSFVSSYEIGQRRLDILEFIKIARVLNTNAVELFAEIAGIRLQS